MKINKLKNLTGVLLLFILTACAQKENTMRPIDELYNSVQPLSYNSKPVYYIEASQSGCFYELYVNGRGVFKLYEQVGLVGHGVCINDAILKTGMQEVTIKLYPLGQTEIENFETFTKNARIDVKVEKYDLLDDTIDEEVARMKVPQIEDKSNLIRIKNLPYFEHTFTFYAEVPYEVKGWSESQDLTKMNQEELEKEVVAFHNNYANIIHNQDEAKWVELTKNRELEYLISEEYNDTKSESVKERKKELKEIFDSEFKKKEPLDPYEMVFGGNGRFVALKSTVEKGESALSFGIESEENGEMVKFRYYSYLYLHKPKGSNQLEIIR